MHIFVTGTDTNVGKTLVCSWLCLHTGYHYFKPIQSGSVEGTDSKTVSALSTTRIYLETYKHQAPLSPHIAAKLEGEEIDLNEIKFPETPNLIIEGAGGVLVPLNSDQLMIDLIQTLQVPTIIVSRSTLGTINHTLLTLAALRERHIPVLGIIMNGEHHPESAQAIADYGKTSILATLPFLPEINKATLKSIVLPSSLKQLLIG